MRPPRFWEAPEHMAAVPQLEDAESVSKVLLWARLTKEFYSQNTEYGDVFACRQDLPEQIRPLERDIANVKRVKNPGPIRVTESKILLGTSSFGVSDIPSIEIGQNVKATNDGKEAAIELRR